MVRDFVSVVLNDILRCGHGGVLMLKFYLDRGARKDADGVMSIAGALFKPFFYDQFLHVWQPFLDGWGASAFHATDFYPGAGEFKRQTPDRMALYKADSVRLPELIAPYVHQLFVVTFKADEFERVAPLAWRQHFGSVTRVAAQMMTHAVGYWADRSGFQGDIAYFYETGEGDDEDVHAGFMQVYQNPKLRKFARMASTPVGVDKGKARGLEVADMLAWHWNKYDAETRYVEKRPMRKDTGSLLRALDERGQTVDVRLVTGDGLRAFLLSHGCTVGPAKTA